MPRACAQLVSEGGAQGSQRMADPDTRLTDDLNKATDGFCNTFCNVLYTATAGVFHSVELWKHNWVLGLAPYVYLAVSFAFVDYITPVRKTWRPLGRERGRTWGIYCHGQMKLIEKAESVAALNGSEREARLFCEQSTAVRVACYKQHCKFWQFGMINHFFNTYLAGELFPICIISHGILNPKHSSLDTIEDVSAATPFTCSFETSKEAAAQMMEVRSDVGVLWVLFSRAFQSARTVIDSLRTLQQLVGDVERVTELIELLDKVTEDKKTEASHTTKDGDMIAFENVDIVTPAGVGLVNDLSFQLKRGESLLLVGHNGAGKSSIFRCLGGLWSAKGGGTITKPQGGDGLHQEIFYIPQKSYNVLGTLQDQMTCEDSSLRPLPETPHRGAACRPRIRRGGPVRGEAAAAAQGRGSGVPAGARRVPDRRNQLGRRALVRREAALGNRPAAVLVSKPRYRCHLGCILLKMPAISLRTASPSTRFWTSAHPPSRTR